MQQDLSRLALVTGAARGIGRGISDSLLEAGYRVIDADIAEPDAPPTSAAHTHVTADVSSEQGRDRIIRAVEAEGGVLHVLVNNAGVSPKVRVDVTEAGTESFDRLMHINARGPHFLTQALVPALRRAATETTGATGATRATGATGAAPAGTPGDSEAAPPTVIFITSSNARAVAVDRSEYCISKAALAMAAQIWAVRLAEWNIPVYDILPGLIKTEMTKPAKDKYDRVIASGGVLQRRWGTPHDIGRTVRALAAGALGYATGQTIRLDGGMFIERY